MKALFFVTMLVVWLAAGSLDAPRPVPSLSAPTVAATPSDTVVITSVGIELSYDVKEIRADAGDTLTIRYDNSESEMTHNFVLVRAEEDIVPVGNAAPNAHRNDFIPEDEMDRIIVHSRLLYPGESDTFSLVVPPPGTYPYICTYSGHFTMMQGRLISTQ